MHLVVLDSVGIGAAPDANDFVNAGVPDGASDTLGHISKSVGLNVPNMAKLGLGNIPRETPLKTVPTESNPTVCDTGFHIQIILAIARIQRVNDS